MTSIEALDGGVLIRKAYERPPAMQLPDLFAQFPGKKLWHYFTLSKFTRFLQTGEVWFSRPQFFDDPHEFSSDEASQRSLIEWRLNSFADEYNRAIRTERDKYLAVVSNLAAPFDKSNDGLIIKQSRQFSEFPDVLLSSLRADLRSWQDSYFISCWRLSDVDSVAIWNQYASLSEGVAISVPHDALKSSLQVNGDVRFGTVNYIDLSSSSDPQHMPPFMYKDVRYKAEEEARFYFQARTQDVGLRGIGLKVDVASLVDRIYVAPNAARWFKAVVAGLVKRYGLNAEIVGSPLGEIPQKFYRYIILGASRRWIYGCTRIPYIAALNYTNCSEANFSMFLSSVNAGGIAIGLRITSLPLVSPHPALSGMGGSRKLPSIVG